MSHMYVCFLYVFFCVLFFFFFSSRRRHTRLVSDWSSDVCSSDLALSREKDLSGDLLPKLRQAGQLLLDRRREQRPLPWAQRSEERRVGKECRSRGSQDQ